MVRTPGRLPSDSWKKRLKRRLVLFLLAACGVFVLVPPFYWPVSAPVSSGFLFRWKPDAWGLEVHHGIDLAAPRGTPVSPSGIGIVGAAGHSPELGNFVRVDHLFGVTTLYGHLDRIDVKPGQPVAPGLNRLGVVGSTGRSTGPHLHFGVFLVGLALPPEAPLLFHSLRRALFGL